jgi:hypothetical protein
MRKYFLLHAPSTGISHSASLQSNATAQAGPPVASKPRIGNRQRSAQELEWLLIWLLLFIYLAGSYLVWAKIEFAWPFS